MIYDGGRLVEVKLQAKNLVMRSGSRQTGR